MDKIKLDKISNFKIGKSIKGFYLCIHKNLKHTINGDEFLDIRLKDSSGFINAKIWNNINVFDVRFKVGDIVAVKGKVLEFKKVNFLNIGSIKKADKDIFNDYNINYNEIISSNISNDKYWKKIFLFIDTINDKHLKNLITSIFKKNKTNIYALSSVYDESGMYEFFLEDIVSVSRILIKFKNIYPNINFDLVIAISMLCKIGLIHKDVKNRELGIHCLSWEIVKSELSLKKNFPEELSLQLQIIITNFNSEYAIKLIKSKEAFLSYYIFTLVQKMNYYNKIEVNHMYNINK